MDVIWTTFVMLFVYFGACSLSLYREQPKLASATGHPKVGSIPVPVQEMIGGGGATTKQTL